MKRVLAVAILSTLALGAGPVLAQGGAGEGAQIQGQNAATAAQPGKGQETTLPATPGNENAGSNTAKHRKPHKAHKAHKAKKTTKAKKSHKHHKAKKAKTTERQ